MKTIIKQNRLGMSLGILMIFLSVGACTLPILGNQNKGSIVITIPEELRNRMIEEPVEPVTPIPIIQNLVARVILQGSENAAPISVEKGFTTAEESISISLTDVPYGTYDISIVIVDLESEPGTEKLILEKSGSVVVDRAEVTSTFDGEGWKITGPWSTLSSTPEITVNSILGITYDSTNIFVANYQTGYILQYPSLQGGTYTEHFLDLSANSISGITSDASYLYLADYSMGTVFKIAKSDLSTPILMKNSLGSTSVFGISNDETYVYVAIPGYVKRISKSDNTTVDFGTGLPVGNLPGLTLDTTNGYLYARFGQAIYRLSTNADIATTWEFIIGDTTSAASHIVAWEPTPNNGNAIAWGPGYLYYVDGTIIKKIRLSDFSVSSVTTVANPVSNGVYFMTMADSRLLISDYQGGKIYYIDNP